MKITDLHGCEIEVTDLREAIKTAKRNTGYSHVDKSFSEFDKRQKAYWTGDFGDIDHLISDQADHLFRWKLTRAFRSKLTTLGVSYELYCSPYFWSKKIQQIWPTARSA